MTVSVSLHATPVIDPRGARKTPVKLAPRLKSVEGKKILLFDNTQTALQEPNYGPILTWFEGVLREKYRAVCSFQSRNLFDVDSTEQMAAMAKSFREQGFDAIVVALCKYGITSPTSMFMAELERAGLPSVQICTEHAIPLASTAAAGYMPGLPIVKVNEVAGDKNVVGKAQAEAIVPDVVAGLTSDLETLIRISRERYPDGGDIVKDGVIDLPSKEATSSDGSGKTVVTFDASDFAEDLYARLCAADMCDGLPVIPATERRVQAMLRFTDLDPDHVVVENCQPSGSNITLRSIAVNAVMAGCLPQYMPIVVAACQAIADPKYRLFQSAITTHPATNCILVSGPLADELGIHSGKGCMGPGFRANATIGRALNMTIMNVTRAIPNKSDMSTLGSPAEFTFCVAESDKDNPWQPLHADLYGLDVTSVTVNKVEGPHNVLDPRTDHIGVLKAFAGTIARLGNNNLVHMGQTIVFLNPTLADMLAKAGWSKRDVKEYLYEIARLPQDISKRRLRDIFPPYFHILPDVPVMRSPDELYVVVCGGRSSQGAVALPWGLSSAVNRPVVLKDGSPLKTLKGHFPRAS